MYVSRNICSFKKLICTLNVLSKFATIRRRPSEASVLFQLIGLNYFVAKKLEKYDQTPEVEIIISSQTVNTFRPSCAIKRTATKQRSEIRVSILLGIKVIVRV